MPRQMPTGRRRVRPFDNERVSVAEQDRREYDRTAARGRYNQYHPRNYTAENQRTPTEEEEDFNNRIRKLKQRILNRIDDGGCVRRSTVQNPVFRWTREELDMMNKCLDLRQT
eukprot:8290219-Pyramimonas_sp.AAC.1